MFYATVIYKDEQASEDNQFGTDIGVNDVLRFETKAERDVFVDEHSYADSITRKDAEMTYREQFRFWSK